MKKFEFDGEIYNDDRIYLLYVCKCTVRKENSIIVTTIYHEEAPKNYQWCVVTYKNTEKGEAIKVDIFNIEHDATVYKDKVEPSTPLVSLNGNSPYPPIPYYQYAKWKEENHLKDYNYKEFYKAGGYNRHECIYKQKDNDSYTALTEGSLFTGSKTLFFITLLLAIGILFAIFEFPIVNFFHLPIIYIREELWPLYLLFCFFIILSMWYELNYSRIPDIFVLPGILIAVVISFFIEEIQFIDPLLGLLVGGVPLYLIALIYNLKTKKIGIGGGAIKLSAMIGVYIGATKIAIALFLCISVIIPLIYYNYYRNQKTYTNYQITYVEVSPLLSIISLSTIFFPYEEFIKLLITIF